MTDKQMNKTTEVFESKNSNYSSTEVERALKLAEEALVKANHFHDYEDALFAVREVLAEPVKQEPVAVVQQQKIHQSDVPFHYIDCQHLPVGTKLYTAPVDAKAIRAEALEEAVKVCEQGTGDAVQTDVLKALWKERERIAEVIRGLK